MAMQFGTLDYHEDTVTVGGVITLPAWFAPVDGTAYIVLVEGDGAVDPTSKTATDFTLTVNSGSVHWMAFILKGRPMVPVP